MCTYNFQFNVKCMLLLLFFQFFSSIVRLVCMCVHTNWSTNLGKKPSTITITITTTATNEKWLLLFFIWKKRNVAEWMLFYWIAEWNWLSLIIGVGHSSIAQHSTFLCYFSIIFLFFFPFKVNKWFTCTNQTEINSIRSFVRSFVRFGIQNIVILLLSDIAGER